MNIDIKPLLRGEKREIVFEYAIPIDYTESGYAVKGDAKVSGKVKDMGGYMELEAECTAAYKTECARCLAPLERECSVEFMRPVAAKLETEDEEEEYLLVKEGSYLDIDEAISEELLLSLPFRTLCSDDCKGLCPKCGCNKNNTECSCVLKEPDPRWAVLKTFKPEGKE